MRVKGPTTSKWHELDEGVRRMATSLSELSPMIAIANEQNPHTPAHDVARDTARSIRGLACAFLKQLLCAAEREIWIRQIDIARELGLTLIPGQRLPTVFDPAIL